MFMFMKMNMKNQTGIRFSISFKLFPFPSFIYKNHSSSSTKSLRRLTVSQSGDVLSRLSYVSLLTVISKKQQAAK